MARDESRDVFVRCFRSGWPSLHDGTCVSTRPLLVEDADVGEVAKRYIPASQYDELVRLSTDTISTLSCMVEAGDVDKATLAFRKATE